MAEAIRLASPADAALLSGLNAAVQDWHVAAYPNRFVADPDPAELAEFFAAAINRPANEIAIFERGGEALGYVWIEATTRAATPLTKSRKVLYVHALAVVEQARRQGVATALLDWTAERAEGLAVDAIVLDHWADNAAASAFYAAQRFRPERIVLTRP